MAKQTEVRRITGHPKITPAKLAEVRALRAKLDLKDKERIISKGREVFARLGRIRAMIASLKAARLKRQLTLEQVAQRSGIGKANLSRLENDEEPNPTLDTVLRIADALGCDDLVISVREGRR